MYKTTKIAIIGNPIMKKQVLIKISFFLIIIFSFLSITNNLWSNQKNNTNPSNEKNISNLDNGTDDLAGQISQQMAAGSKTAIAVNDFVDLDGNVTRLGRFLAEELVTKLFQTHKYRVIERPLLNKALTELKFNLSNLVDPASAKQLGRFLGVDAIVTGTITDLGTRVKVNARLISTETGDVFSAAATNIEKDSEVKELFGAIVESKQPSKTTHNSLHNSYQKESSYDSKQSTDSNIPSGYFYLEDFAKIPKGTLPEGWIGGENMAVKKGPFGKMELSDFEVRHDFRIQTNKIVFPQNFDLELYFWWDYGSIRILLGDLVINLRDNGDINIGASNSHIDERLENKIINLTIQKRNKVYSFLLDNSEIIVARYEDLDFDSIVFTNKNAPWPTNHFGLQKILGKIIIN